MGERGRGMPEPLFIDGSYGEGGGQVLRTALALAALLGRPVTVDHIRANRPKPGLRPQHLMAVRAMAQIAAAELQGDHENSTKLTFLPGKLQSGSFRFDIGTAGACTLLIAAILPPLLFASGPSEVVVTGGTHVPFSPPYHYFAQVFIPGLEAMGCKVESELRRWGWYPAGAGEIRLRVTPCRRLQPLRLEERGELQRLELLIGLTNLPDHIAQREEKALHRYLIASDGRFESHVVNPDSAGQGNGLFLKAAFAHAIAGFSALGRRGVPAEQIAAEVGRGWLAFVQSRAAVDRHLADQLILYMALAGGESSLITEQLSRHLLTNIRVVEQFLPVRFEVREKEMGVKVKGCGFSL